MNKNPQHLQTPEVKAKKLQTYHKNIELNRKHKTVDIINGLAEYIVDCQQDNRLPTIAGACLAIKCNKQTLYNRAEDNEDIANLMEVINLIAEDKLIIGGLDNSFNSGFAKFLLEAKHKYNSQPTTLIQNNNTTISGEWLKKAFEKL